MHLHQFLYTCICYIDWRAIISLGLYGRDSGYIQNLLTGIVAIWCLTSISVILSTKHITQRTHSVTITSVLRQNDVAIMTEGLAPWAQHIAVSNFALWVWKLSHIYYAHCFYTRLTPRFREPTIFIWWHMLNAGIMTACIRTKHVSISIEGLSREWKDVSVHGVASTDMYV